MTNEEVKKLKEDHETALKEKHAAEAKEMKAWYAYREAANKTDEGANEEQSKECPSCRVIGLTPCARHYR